PHPAPPRSEQAARARSIAAAVTMANSPSEGSGRTWGTGRPVVGDRGAEARGAPHRFGWLAVIAAVVVLGGLTATALFLGHGGALPGDGAARRRGSRRAAEAPRPAPARRGGHLPGAGGAGARQDARRGHRAPRSQAREPLPHPARRRLGLPQDPRLRHRQG